MVYIMSFYVDGGCRRNGHPDAIGASAACMMSPYPAIYQKRTRPLFTNAYNATNQRAELLAIIIALEWALENNASLRSRPLLDVRIHSDSTYAVGCMQNWIYNWVHNGWINAQGGQVENRDLIEEAYNLHVRVDKLGIVRYIYIPRELNKDADRACNEAMDAIEDAQAKSSSQPMENVAGHSETALLLELMRRLDRLNLITLNLLRSKEETIAMLRR